METRPSFFSSRKAHLFISPIVLSLCLSGLLCPVPACADTGIVVYGSKGVDERRTDSGHISLIATNVCAEGISQVRECRPGERPGVVITSYAHLAFDYSKSVFVVPLLDHFTATDEPDSIPVLSSGPTLRAAQIEYWRQHLRPYFPPMRRERYQEIRDEMDRFDAGRTLRRFLTMEFIGTMLGAHKHQDETEPIALIDPVSRELIPDGRWREAIGSEHTRGALALMAPSSISQELRLVPYLEQSSSIEFNVMSDNCSDFVERALLTVYGDQELKFRSRTWEFADAWITSPLSVATGFLSYAKKNSVPMRVVFLPITAGTRRSRFSVHSLSRGALVPDPTQGKMAFFLKTYFNTLNPLLGVTSFTVDQLSRFANLPGLIHDRHNGDLFSLGSSSPQYLNSPVDGRDRVRIFGTSSCWKAKQEAFQKLTLQAVELGILTKQEEHLVLKSGRPFLLPRVYEHPLPTIGETSSQLGLGNCFVPGCSSSHPQVEASLPSRPALDGGVIPGRLEIRHMAESSKQEDRQAAFTLMTSVINFDLSSEATDRRTAQAFDKDWQLLVEVAGQNHMSVANGPGWTEPLEACSCRRFDEGVERQDALKVALGFTHRLMRGERELLTGPIR